MAEMSAPPKVALSPEEELARYHALSAAAVTGLVFGLLSPLALVGPGTWFLPVLAAVFSLLGLWRIRRREGLVGRTAALLGLVLAASMGAAGPAAWYGHRWLLAREARCFADKWFDYLAEGKPEKAFLLTLPPRWRPSLEADLSEYYRTGPRWRQGLEKYVAPAEKGDPPNLVRTLLALGPRAKARYYEYAGQTQQQGKLVVYLIYAVSFPASSGSGQTPAQSPAPGNGPSPPEQRPADSAAGQSTQTVESAVVPAKGSEPVQTFFVLLELMRHEKPGRRTNWQLLRATGGVRPAAFQVP